jgi:hypothetical protein
MEYFIGAIITLAVWISANKYLNKEISKIKIKKVIYRQSHLFEIIKPTLPYMPVPRKELVSQASKFKKSNMKKVMFFMNKAYWIENNAVYSADITENGIDKESKIAIDTMTMDDVELKQMQYIVEKLTEQD